MRFSRNEKGSTLTIVVVIISLLLLSSSFLLSLYVKNSQSIYSQEKTTKSYYIAESGLVEAIDKIYTMLDNEEVIIDVPEDTEEPEDPKCTKNDKKKKCKEDTDVKPEFDADHPACRNNPEKNKHCPDVDEEIIEEGEFPNNESEESILPQCRKETTQYNPQCEGVLPSEWDYDIEFKSEHEAFEDSYKEKGYVSWYFEGIKEENIYYIQSTGTFNNAKTTLEAGIIINNENKIEIIYLKEI